MAFQPVPQTARFTMKHTYAGGPIPVQNVLYITKVDGVDWSSADLISLTAAVNANWIVHVVNPLMTATTTYIGVDSRTLETDPGFTVNTVAANPGTRTGEAVSSRLAFNLQLAVRGGNHKRAPRLFLGVGTEADLANNLWLTSFRDAVVTGFVNFRAAMDTSVFKLCSVVRVRNGAPLSQGIAVPWDTTLIGRRNVATQRDRKPPTIA